MRYHNAVIRRLIAVSMACLLSIGFAAGYHADYSMAAEATDDTGAGELATDVLGTSVLCCENYVDRKRASRYNNNKLINKFIVNMRMTL